ncbi:U32 family peptidase [Selenomonas sp. TAMA-11512]|uniref:peptidase U32 family protein n=1 Tax=Selenomonas sp. TAMA-11512 TaxID=3095337 RepID=UPI00308F1354|nr:U32 family peptidase [Selenomonas sp. TAMA-11512]
MAKKPELLAPAGNLEKLKTAIYYGADAVYLGGKTFGLRAFSGNFTHAAMEEGVRFAHERGKKVYVTLNIFPHEQDVKTFPAYLDFLRSIGVDAVLVSDLGLFMQIRKDASDMEVHVSTQANNVNSLTVNAWQELGASRIVLARELSRAEIQSIRAATSAELEMFVHGAMCISYSGRCLLSSYFTGRDANRGACAQVCRWKFSLVEENRPNEYFPVAEDERGTYIMNSKDLCLLPYVGELSQMGIDSLKIEGRMKSVHYVATAVKVYREAIDACAQNGGSFIVRPAWIEELQKASHRIYTTGFYEKKPDGNDQIYGTSSYEQTTDFVGVVLGYDEAAGYVHVEQRNLMELGDELEVLQPHGDVYRVVIWNMTDMDGAAIERAPHAQQHIRICFGRPIEKYALLRRYRKESYQ